MKTSYGLLQYQLEKLHAVVADTSPLKDNEVAGFLCYLEDVMRDAGYTPDEHAQIFFDDEDEKAFGPGSFDLTNASGDLQC